MNAFAILFADYYNGSKNPIAENRTVASIPFGGRYRLCDFLLSSLVDAGLENVAFVTGKNYNSLVDHLGNGKDWDLSRKNSGIKLLTPHLVGDEDTTSASKVKTLMNFTGYIQSMQEEYVILSDCNFLATPDFSDIINYHISKNADITAVYRGTYSVTPKTFVLFPNADGRVENARFQNISTGEEINAACGIYVMKKRLLLELLDRSLTFDWTDFERDCIFKNLTPYKVFAYQHNGYFSKVDTLTDYYNASMDMLNPSVRRELYDSGVQIITRVKDTAPTIYSFKNKVSNSIIADGCQIEGEVYDSIVFRGTRIREGAVVRNSVIIQNTIISKNAMLECVITDKNVIVNENRRLSGAQNYPFYVAKNVIS